jgi:hypothetical protein
MRPMILLALIVIALLLLSACGIPDMPGPIGIPGV